MLALVPDIFRQIDLNVSTTSLPTFDSPNFVMVVYQSNFVNRQIFNIVSNGCLLFAPRCSTHKLEPTTSVKPSLNPKTFVNLAIASVLKTSLEDCSQHSETSPFIKFQRSLTFGASLIIWIRIRTSSISGFCGISSIFFIKLVLNFAFEPTIFNLYRNSFRFSHDFPKVSRKFSSFFHKVLRTENVFCVRNELYSFQTI